MLLSLFRVGFGCHSKLSFIRLDYPLLLSDHLIAEVKKLQPPVGGQDNVSLMASNSKMSKANASFPRLGGVHRTLSHLPHPHTTRLSYYHLTPWRVNFFQKPQPHNPHSPQPPTPIGPPSAYPATLPHPTPHTSPHPAKKRMGKTKLLGLLFFRRPTTIPTLFPHLSPAPPTTNNTTHSRKAPTAPHTSLPRCGKCNPSVILLPSFGCIKKSWPNCRTAWIRYCWRTRL